jgi:molecular chaperone GrpE
MHKGLEVTESAMLSTLKRHGVTRFDPSVEGETFDPNMHEAVFHAPMEGKEDGTVFHTQQKGYSLNGRVLRVSTFAQFYDWTVVHIADILQGGASRCC